MEYSLPKGIGKYIKYFIVFGLAIGINYFVLHWPEIADITIGAALGMLLNWLKVKWDLTWIP